MNIQSLHDPHPPPRTNISGSGPSGSSNENIINLLGFLPSSWQGSDESLRHALSYRAEEERRRAEEERTKQEEHRLELRKKDLELLREGIRYGIPPSMIPFIFIGNGVTGSTAEWIREYVARIWQAQQQQQPQQPQGPLELSSQQQGSLTQSGTGVTGSVPGPQDSRYQHHRSQSAHSIQSLTSNVPPPPPPPPPHLQMPALSSLGSSQIPPPSPYSPEHQSSTPQSIYVGSGQQVITRTPPLQVRQMEFSGAPQSVQSQSAQSQTKSYLPISPSRSMVKSPSPPAQPTIQFHHWQPNTSGKERSTKESMQSQSQQQSSGSSALSPLGNGIPRSPTRSILNPSSSDEQQTIISSPKRRSLATTLVFESQPKPSTPLSPPLHHTSLPPISTLGSANSPRKRGVGHVRHRSDATLHGYEPYPRVPAPHALGGLNGLERSPSQTRGHRRTESSWDTSGVGVLAAAAAESAERELKRDKGSAEERRE
ncbi:hypothetical protein V1511DRAFT_459588 [Dipodascopsis uninucleata]